MLKIFLFTPENTGVGWYRGQQVFRWLGRHKLAEIESVPFTGTGDVFQIPTELIEKSVKWADIIFSTTPKSSDQLSMLMAARELGKCKLVVDIDDYLNHLNDDHPSKNVYLPEGDRDPAWYAQRSLAYADLVVTTNKFLKEQYSGLNSNIYIHPNSIDLEVWKYPRKKYKKFRIGWAGAVAHRNDLGLIKNVIPEVKKRLKDKVEFVGFCQSGQYKDIGFDKWIDWVDMMKYPQTYAKAGFDLALAPMRDSEYNRGKSNLRLIEANALGIPVIASPVGEYENYPCFHADWPDDWVEKILRFSSGKYTHRYKFHSENQHKYFLENYETSIVAPKLLKKLEEVNKTKWKKK